MKRHIKQFKSFSINENYEERDLDHMMRNLDDRIESVNIPSGPMSATRTMIKFTGDSALSKLYLLIWKANELGLMINVEKFENRGGVEQAYAILQLIGPEEKVGLLYDDPNF